MKKKGLTKEIIGNMVKHWNEWEARQFKINNQPLPEYMRKSCLVLHSDGVSCVWNEEKQEWIHEQPVVELINTKNDVDLECEFTIKIIE